MNPTLSSVPIADAATIPWVEWPTWEDGGPATLPAEAYRIDGDNVPADEFPDHLASIGVGSRELMAGRFDPVDGCIDFRPVGWLTIRPDGRVELEPND